MECISELYSDRMDLVGSGWIKPKPFRCQALRLALREGHAVVNERW